MNVRTVTRAAARIELWLRKCRAGMAGLLYFIANYVWIEDPDTPGGKVRFRLWPKQAVVAERFFDSRWVIVLKARQLGLTWLALAYALWQCVFRPGFKVITLSDGLENAKELISRIKFMAERLPPWMIRDRSKAPPGYTGVTYEATTEKVVFFHEGEADSEIQALPASQDAGRSLTCSLVIIDEQASQQWADQIWNAAFPTINRPTGGQVFIISTGRKGTFFEEFWSTAEARGFLPVFLNWRADPRRDEIWYERTRDAMLQAGDNEAAFKQEYPTNPEDAFSLGPDSAFPMWDREVHIAFDQDWYPPLGWAIVRVYDAGFHQAMCKWYAISPDGFVVCYREYYPRGVIDEEQAKEIVRLSRVTDPRRSDFGASEIIEYTVADTSAWSPSTQTGIPTAEVFGQNGVPMIQAQKDRENGWRRAREYLWPFDGPGQDEAGKPLKVAKLRFTAACVHTIRTYPTIPTHPSNPEDVWKGHCEDHPQDCDRYFAMSRPAPPMTDEQKQRMRKEWERRRRPLFKRTGY